MISTGFWIQDVIYSKTTVCQDSGSGINVKTDINVTVILIDMCKHIATFAGLNTFVAAVGMQLKIEPRTELHVYYGKRTYGKQSNLIVSRKKQMWTFHIQIATE